MNDSTYLDIFKLPNSQQLTIAELETSESKKRRGILPISASQIRRLEARGLFPKAKTIPGMRGNFYSAGEVKTWMHKNNLVDSQYID